MLASAGRASAVATYLAQYQGQKVWGLKEIIGSLEKVVRDYTRCTVQVRPELIMRMAKNQMDKNMKNQMSR